MQQNSLSTTPCSKQDSKAETMEQTWGWWSMRQTSGVGEGMCADEAGHTHRSEATQAQAGLLTAEYKNQACPRPTCRRKGQNLPQRDGGCLKARYKNSSRLASAKKHHNIQPPCHAGCPNAAAAGRGTPC